MSYTLRIRKNGERVYEIRVSRGRDPIKGKPLKPYTMTWRVPESYSAKVAEREAAKIATKFEEDCKAGLILTKEEKREQKIAAERRKAQEESEYEKSETVNEYITRFYEMKDGKGQKTRYNYKNVLKNNLGSELGELKMRDITPAMLRRIFDEINKNTKYSTMCYYSRIFKVFFESALEHDVIESNPMSDVKLPKRSKKEIQEDSNKKALTEEEVRRVIDVVNKEPLNYRALIYFLMDTGCRLGESLAISWDDIDLQKAEVTISKNRVYSPDVGYYETSPKNGKTRVIYLTQQCVRVLKEWKAEQKKRHFQSGKTIECCFEDKRGNRINEVSFRRYLHDLESKCGVKNLHPHKLRHTMITLSILHGEDIVTISERAGHANPSITAKIYAHTNEKAQRRAADTLGSVLYGNNTKNA